MKKLVLSLILSAVFVITGFTQQLTPIPIDPNVRHGILDNGMTYYIRHNEKPAQRADFYIAQKVGSILEEENQRGLAHFLEHMAFNGTKNLPGMTLRDYLQRRGIKFGENLNAGTGIDQTVYMVTDVPTTIPGLVDTCLLILHDWSSFITLEEDEIDNERGVILEELRTREDANERIMEAILPEMYPNSPYANRLPGGLPEVVANFEYQTLRDYYHKWYRPDLQGIIIVGDVDVDAIEARIKEMFADIPEPVNPAERTLFEIADNEEPIVAICSDPEQTSYEIKLFYKQDAVPFEQRNTMEYWIQQYVNRIISTMFNSRMHEIAQKSNPPFINAYGYYGNYFIAPTKDAWNNDVMAKDLTGVDEAFTTIVHENNRMQQFGFTVSEYERAKADFMKQIESQYEDKNNQKNSSYVYECLYNFLTNEPMPGIEMEYTAYQHVIPNISLENINMYVKELISEENLVITLTAPEKENEVLPTKKRLLEIYEKANADSVEAYKEEVFEESVVKNLPKSGKIKKEETLPEFDATQWTLSNDIKVIYKQTKFKEDEILFTANSYGGLSVLDQNDPYTLNIIDKVIGISGVGDFSATDIPKVLAGKKVVVRPNINVYSEGLSGQCSPKDMETMMQFIYLYFTAQRVDNKAYQSYLQRIKAALANMELNPMVTFSDSIKKVMYDNHYLIKRMKAEDYDKADYIKATEMIKDRFADPNNFTFYFVGNIDVETFKPLVEQYLASLKKNKRKENWKDIGLSITEKDHISQYRKQMENPKVTIYISYNGEMEYTFHNQLYMKALKNILDIVYTRTVREEEGGTYGVGVMGQLNNKPKDSYVLSIAFDTNDDVYEKLMNLVVSGFEDIANNGPKQEDLTKVIENFHKNRDEELEENDFWMSAIKTFEEDKINIVGSYDGIIKSMTIQSIADFAKQVLKGYKKGYKKEVVQLPTK